ncbi:hypothetical protein FJM67_14790 [Maribrevibacterium harenarium]|uniref:Lipoprotein n=1 Tax=Maribrevibacterium harenarium TaxID=2589817 RepID=A0A501WCZ1_9GAMM|nr:YajG family lipoprotein [Maribrevibacterium harenarium]TPE47258.1 hypothetical protein FJM67_14790 [Maribrevibacterium harenarium]
MKISRFAFLPATLLLLAGCASTTHQLNLLQQTPVAAQQVQNATVIVSSQSSVNSNIGTITTGIGEQADLVVNNSPEAALANELINQLKAQGIVASQINTSNKPAHQLQLAITELSYTTQTQALKTIATISFKLNANVVAGTTNYKANYESELVDEYGTLPDAYEVEASLDKLIRNTVARLVADPNVMTLLRRPLP